MHNLPGPSRRVSGHTWWLAVFPLGTTGCTARSSSPVERQNDSVMGSEPFNMCKCQICNTIGLATVMGGGV